MRNFFCGLFGLLCLAACDLQPKITSLPDSVGDFISSRYPALLADPDTEPEIYNSAVSDYGIYASPEIYGSADNEDYVNYAGLDDYILPEDNTDVVDNSASDDDVDNSAQGDSVADDSDDAENTEDTDNTNESDQDEQDADDEVQSESTDVIDIPEYEPDELYVPARAAAGTVVVRRGDTLYAIARDNKMTLDEIAKLNNLSSPYTIRTGQVLKIQPEKKPEVKPEVKKETVKVEPAKAENPPAKVVQKVSEKTEPKKADNKVAKVEQRPKTAATKPKATPAIETVKKTEVKPKADVRVPVKEIRVARGDTLYSVSRQYSVPVNDLAVMNGLAAPFALSVGQVLRVPDLSVKKLDSKPKADAVKKSEKKEVKKEPAKKVEPKVTKTESTKKADTKKPGVKKADVKKPEAKKTDVKKVEAKKPENKKPEKKQVTKQEPAKQKTESQKIAARSSSKFSWPVRGTVLSHYGAKTGGLYNDGINISAALNTPVVASENGVVAYAGNEVRGMGNLVIIQHADGWMTVYGHMNSMTVRRGARVSVGQKIGAVGKTGKVTTPQLHFEIRKGTKAYNPVNYLKK